MFSSISPLAAAFPKHGGIIFSSSFLLFCTFAFQLDFCQEMARYLTGASAWFIVWSAVSLFLDICYFSNCDAYYMGMLVDNDIGSRYNWFGCNHGWHCPFVGILFNHALVENTMAKLKYVFMWFFKSCYESNSYLELQTVKDMILLFHLNVEVQF